MIVKAGREEILTYLEDASNFREGNAEKLYIPEDEGDLIYILTDCAKNSIPVTISSGGTGTVGGRIPRDGVIISMEKFNRIPKIDKEEKSATLQAGVVIDEFLKLIEVEGLFYPPFPTERTAFIGGNVATNASGEYSFRFGPTRRYVKKIRMVLTDGRILQIERNNIYESNGIIDYGIFKVPLPSYRTPPVKCSAGYFSQEGMDGIDLVIGSEGTLGVITEVQVSLIEALPPRFIVIVFLKDEEGVPLIVKQIKKMCGDALFSLEFFDSGSLKFLKNDFPAIPDGACAIYAESIATTEEIERWLDISERYGAVDTWLAEDVKNYEKLIDFRHRLPENINAYFRKIGIVKVAMDIAVPEDSFPEMYGFYRYIMKSEKIHSILFGHIGENHLHFNLFPSSDEEKRRAKEIYEICVKKALSLGGTVAAEHGIGKIKHRWLEIMYGREGLKEMAKIKKIFDPYCILGLDNIFPAELLK
ncbi:MAG TPA: FAD-binding oxidoreductase [bacterium]|nr:FAD-binding oxidoreductase [bacterium]HPP29626.1 FAD-binding oxidoreductase [bacterium]